MVGGNQAREEWLAKADRAEVIVFDLDGTLVDSDHANFLAGAYKDAVMCVLSTKIKMDLIQGTRITREVLKLIIPEITEKQIEDIFSLKERIYHKYISETNFNPQLIEIIAHSQGKEVVWATNSRRCRSEMLLNLIDKFSRKIYRGAAYQRDKYLQCQKEECPFLCLRTMRILSQLLLAALELKNNKYSRKFE